MVIDRKTKKQSEVINPTGANFLYKTILGRILLKLITNVYTARLVEKYMSTKLSIKRINQTIKDY